ncbi:MAG: hypothetical protein WBM14_03555 [Terracidiphilus sp.]
MNPRLLATLLVLCGASLLAQAPAPETHSSELGFSYSLPSDWEVVDAHPMLPVVKQQQTQSATSEAEKKGIECVQLALTARHGTPASVVVIVELPFACFGQQMTDKDLPGFAEGASEGIKKTFVVSEPVYGAYMLGTHSLWIERAQGVVIGHPEAQYTVEIACSLIKKGAVCWMAMASDKAALETFEHGSVTLDGEAPAVLVPATAFDKKPGS